MKNDIDWVVNSVVQRIMYKYQPNYEKEELYAEAYAKAVEAQGKFRGDSQLSTYMHTVVTNHLIDCIKKKRIQTVPLLGIEEVYEDVSRDSKITLDQIEATLEGKELEIFKMLREGYSHQEISNKVKLSRQMIWKLVKRLNALYKEN